MQVAKTFKDIITWQKAHTLALGIYEVTKKFPRAEEFGLANQMRRVAVSVPSNIAEGFKRKSSKDSIHFCNMAEGSLEELKYQILLARDLKYITPKEYDGLTNIADEVGRLLFGWKRSQ